MNWTDEQRAAIENLVARDGCCSVSTDEVCGLTERIGWNPPAGGAETVNVRCQRLQEHLKAVLKVAPFEIDYGLCAWCDASAGDAHHDDDCPWALARAYLDSLEAK